MNCDGHWPVTAQVTAPTEVCDDSQGQAGYDPSDLKVPVCMCCFKTANKGALCSINIHL